MNCEECLTQVEEYLERYVDIRFAEHVLAHISGCWQCKRNYEYLRREQEVFSSYLINIEASSALRSGLEARIKAEKSARHAFYSTSLGGGILFLFRALINNPVLAGSLALLLIGFSVALLTHSSLNSDAADKISVSANDISNNGETSAKPENLVMFENPIEYPEQTGENQSGDISASPENSNVKASRADAEREAAEQARRKGIVKSQLLSSKTGQFYKKDFDEDNQLNAVFKLTPAQIDNLERETRKQVEKVQLLLRSFRNTPLGDGETTFDVAYDKQQAKKLLRRNISLRRAAEYKDDIDIQEVLGSLEPYLLDIANLPDDASPDEVRAIMNRIREQEIVAALQIY